MSRQLVGEWAASEPASAEAVRLAEEHGFPHVLAMATVNRGWALMMRGRTAEGIAMLRNGVAMANATGAGLLRPSYLGMLAATHVMEGDRKAALVRLDEALALVDRTGERLQEAALLIAKSHLLAEGDQSGKSSENAANVAEDCLRRALDVAQRQTARLLELRAAVALARHCRERGRAAEARTLLTAAQAWFAERRCAAPEAVAAHRLLAELQASS